MDSGSSFSPIDLPTQQQGRSRLVCEEEATQTVWNRYRTWARQHQHLLNLLDDTVSRVLFWTPNGNNSRWRDVAWGVLELHRLLLDHSVLQPHGQSSRIASIEATDADTDGQQQQRTNRRIQWALTIVQTLYPVLHQMVGGVNHTAERQAKVRKYLETTRFLLRGLLLLRYWNSLGSSNVPPGLLLEGGRMTLTPPAEGWTLEEEQRRIEQHNYVGRRTGKRWCAGHPPIRTDWVARRRIQLGELLYIVRPLVQAHATSGPQQQLTVPLLLDLASLWLSAQHTNNNPISKAEWQRRRIRLWLYLLRSPIWDRYTEPAATVIRDRVEHNFLGRMASNYIWEWLYYWKDYRMEEG